MNLTIANFVSSSCSAFNGVSPIALFHPDSLMPGGGGFVPALADLFQLENYNFKFDWKMRGVSSFTRKATGPYPARNPWRHSTIPVFLAGICRAVSAIRWTSWRAATRPARCAANCPCAGLACSPHFPTIGETILPAGQTPIGETPFWCK